MASVSATVTLRGNAQRNARELQTQLQRATAKAVRAASLTVKDETVGTLRQAIGPDERMSNVGRTIAGARLSVRFNLSDLTTANPSALVQARGPWQLVENQTRAHTIRPRRRRARAAGGAAVATPWGPRAYVIHPGTRGKKPWARGVAAAEPKVQKIYRATLHDAVARSGWGR